MCVFPYLVAKSDWLSSDELFAAVAPVVRDHDLVYAVGPSRNCKFDPFAALVQVLKHWPHLEVGIGIEEAIIPEVQASKHSVHIVSPDVVGHKGIVAVLLELPEHLPSRDPVVPGVQEQRLCTAVCIPTELLQGPVKSLLDGIQSGLVHHLIGKAVRLEETVVIIGSVQIFKCGLVLSFQDRLDVIWDLSAN